jgi:hypothetical protein
VFFRIRQTAAAAIRSVSGKVCWMQEFLLPNGRYTLLWSFYDQRVKTAHIVCLCMYRR